MPSVLVSAVVPMSALPLASRGVTLNETSSKPATPIVPSDPGEPMSESSRAAAVTVTVT